MIFRRLAVLGLLLSAVAYSAGVLAEPQQSLRGSQTSVQRQYNVAKRDGLEFVGNSGEIAALVESGALLRVRENSNIILHEVSYPYARPAAKLLLERLSGQYRRACGEKLTVTSLLRPIDQQPANASHRSVHPAGMAIDLRIPRHGRCRSWLQQTLLSLEGSGVLDVTRERWPPHYHIAVFSDPYLQYVARLTNSTREYSVRRGDTLSRIAAASGVSVAHLRAANGISGDLINIGQRLLIPAVNSLASNSPAVETISYKVRRGDTLWEIAKRFNTSVGRIRAQNGLSSNLLSINQELRITPGGAS